MNENLEKKVENKEKEVTKGEEANKVMKNRLSVLEKTHFEENMISQCKLDLSLSLEM